MAYCLFLVRGILVGPNPCGLTKLNRNACGDVSHEADSDDANIFVLILSLLFLQLNKLLTFPVCCTQCNFWTSGDFIDSSVRTDGFCSVLVSNMTNEYRPHVTLAPRFPLLDTRRDFQCQVPWKGEGEESSLFPPLTYSTYRGRLNGMK